MNKLHFLEWLNKGSKILESSTNSTIGGTLSVRTYTLTDGRIFVVADNALVSYDKGFYETYNRGSETATVIRKIIKQQYSL